MKWVKVENKKPISGVDVHVVTKSGIRSVAKYWYTTKKWLTVDSRISTGDDIIKWKYEEAVFK